ncbi:hypothetical protein HKBW3S47_02480, partial [Candidatus Hakubella thermalkaliphila]
DDDTWNEDWANELIVETQLLKSITAKPLFSRFPRFRKAELWGGEHIKINHIADLSCQNPYHISKGVNPFHVHTVCDVFCSIASGNLVTGFQLLGAGIFEDYSRIPSEV